MIDICAGPAGNASGHVRNSFDKDGSVDRQGKEGLGCESEFETGAAAMKCEKYSSSRASGGFSSSAWDKQILSHEFSTRL